MNPLHFIKTASKEANILAAASAVILAVKIFILDRYEAIFNGAYEAGIIVEGLLTSILASYIFYLLVVHLKEQSDKETLYPYISKHSKRIVGECQAQLTDISKASGDKLELQSLSMEVTKSAFSKIAPYSKAPLMIGHGGVCADWFQYFDFHNERTRESVRKLLDKLPFLHANHINLISRVDDCPHFWFIKAMVGSGMPRTGNKELSTWADTFFDYCSLCRELDVFNNDNKLSGEV